MTTNGVLQIVFYFAVLAVLVKPLGAYMARVYEGQSLFGLDRVLGPVERLVYKLCGVDPKQEMGWKMYAWAMLLFSLVGMLLLYGQQRLQQLLPLNPQGFSAVSPDSSFNTAASFTTNTNWQGYAGETTMSYLTQMAGLAVHNFVSAAAGMAVLVALIRGMVRRETDLIGNFWVDLVRTTLYILLPLSLVFAVFLVSQGVIQNFSDYKSVNLVQATGYDTPKLDKDGNPVKDDKGNAVMEHVAVTQQVVPMGPVASQIAIKQLGTNGGGFFNTNSAHPFENPTPLSNFVEMLAILLIPAALCYTFGKMVGDTGQGWAILAAMTIIFVALLVPCVMSEQKGNPRLNALGVDQAAGAKPQAEEGGGNMEGKELRFGIANSALWATATTATSNGSVNSMHDSYTPMGGLMPMWLIQLGEVIYGGVGSGLYGLLMFAIVAVFIAGLMVGRTPEYLGKKIESYEMKMASLTILIPPAVVLIFTAIAVVCAGGLAGILGGQGAPHGFSEILYAFSSMGNNNGSAFAGLSANTPFYNNNGGVAMLISRFWLKVPVLAIAGSLARKKYTPPGSGTLPTHTPLFAVMLIATIVIVGALTFFPALALGPIAEHFMLAANP